MCVTCSLKFFPNFDLTKLTSIFRALRAFDKQWHIKCFVCSVTITFFFLIFDTTYNTPVFKMDFRFSLDMILSQECKKTFEGSQNFYSIDNQPVCGPCAGVNEDE